VQYTYAVTAFDMGMVSFKVKQLNTDSNAESDENYCNGEDSYCADSDFYCSENDTHCDDCSLPIICELLNEQFNVEWTNEEETPQESCEGSAGGTWNVVEYTDSTSCVNHSICDEGIDSHVSKTLCDNENSGNDLHSSSPGTDHWNEYEWNEATYSFQWSVPGLLECKSFPLFSLSHSVFDT
jgi:hypothetical protein